MTHDEHYRIEKNWNFPLIMTTFLFVFLLYAGLNYWIYVQARSQNLKNQDVLTPVQSLQQPIQTTIQTSTPSSASTTKPSVLTPSPTKTVIQQLVPSKLTPTPKATTVTPNTTPQTYACDPSGVCGVYENTAEKGCPKTFQDPKCSNQCKQIENRCKI